MKIAFDHQTFTEQSFGGISRYYSILASELIKQNQDVRIFAGLHRNNYIGELKKGVVNGLNLKEYPPKTGRIFQLFNHGFSQARTLMWKPDVFHETYYSDLPVVKTSAVRVTSVYDMIHEIFDSNSSLSRNIVRRKKLTIDRVDHVISISNSTKKDLIEQLGVEESKISVVHLGVDVDTFLNQGGSNIFEGFPYILYVGSRGGYKNFEGFLNACALSSVIKNKIKIVSFGGGCFNKKELSMIARLGFKNNFVEYISGSDTVLASLYAHAICFVYPSLYEGFGLPPLEAMAAKCPVVSSNTSSMPEVVNNAGVYFDPYNIEDMKAAIEKVILDEDLQGRLIKLGVENAKLFSWGKSAQKTQEVYKRLTGK